MAVAIGTEGRIKHAQDVRAGHSDIFEGLDFWAPNINIFRDPRWGRGQETYGEDPFLTARMGVAFVTGMQGDDPRYYRVIATPKHFAVHSGPEPTRHTADVTVSKHDELDTYLPAFRAAVTEGKADSVMCAYNSINGEPACANQFLLEDQLRGKWGFKGYVVSDCGAVRDICRRPSLRAHPARGFGHQPSARHGQRVHRLPRQGTRRSRLQALYRRREAGLPQRERDRHRPRSPLYRAHEARHVRSAGDGALYQNRREPSRQRRASRPGPQARQRVHGPAQERRRPAPEDFGHQNRRRSVRSRIRPTVLLGNYNGIPTHTVSILEGLRKEFAGATINYVPGTGSSASRPGPCPRTLLSTDGKPGVKVTYLKQDIVADDTERKPEKAALARHAHRADHRRLGAAVARRGCRQSSPSPSAGRPPSPRRKQATTISALKPTASSVSRSMASTSRRCLNYPHGVDSKLTATSILKPANPYNLVVDYSPTDTAALHLPTDLGQDRSQVQPGGD